MRLQFGLPGSWVNLILFREFLLEAVMEHTEKLNAQATRSTMQWRIVNNKNLPLYLLDPDRGWIAIPRGELV